MTAATGAPSNTWRKLTVGALVGMAVVELVAPVLLDPEGGYPVFALVIGLPLLVVAGLVATGRRWGATVAVIVSALFVVVTVIGTAPRLTEFTMPELLAATLFVALGLIGVGAGIATVVQRHVGPGSVQ